MKAQDNLKELDSQSLLKGRALDFTSEIENLDLPLLKMTLKKLNYLSFHLDPYDLDNTRQEVQNLIEEFKLSEFLGNPFDFTNILLKMIDTTENLINTKHQ